MGKNLLHLIKAFQYQGIPVAHVKLITKQILVGIDFLHTQCSIVHTDLKPENFLMAPAEPYDLAAVQRERKEVERQEKAKWAKEKEGDKKSTSGSASGKSSGGKDV